MGNIAFLMKHGNMSYYEVMGLPYIVFLSLVKHFTLFELMKNPEYREQLKKEEMLLRTEPDWERLNPLTEKR